MPTTSQTDKKIKELGGKFFEGIIALVKNEMVVPEQCLPQKRSRRNASPISELPRGSASGDRHALSPIRQSNNGGPVDPRIKHGLDRRGTGGLQNSAAHVNNNQGLQ